MLLLRFSHLAKLLSLLLKFDKIKLDCKNELKEQGRHLSALMQSDSENIF